MSFADQTYWGRALPGFGDPTARLLLVGLAPAAHGGNRTGRMFTGDRSGDFLFAALHRAGFASSPLSIDRHDGLTLRQAYITAAVRCAPPANRPTPEERARCSPFLAREFELLSELKVVLALGAFALDALLRQPYISSNLVGRGKRPKFAHGAEFEVGAVAKGGSGLTLLCAYHPSQRNVFTGLLTVEMLDTILCRARALCEPVSSN